MEQDISNAFVSPASTTAAKGAASSMPAFPAILRSPFAMQEDMLESATRPPDTTLLKPFSPHCRMEEHSAGGNHATLLERMKNQKSEIAHAGRQLQLRFGLQGNIHATSSSCWIRLQTRSISFIFRLSTSVMASGFTSARAGYRLSAAITQRLFR